MLRAVEDGGSWRNYRSGYAVNPYDQRRGWVSDRLAREAEEGGRWRARIAQQHAQQRALGAQRTLDWGDQAAHSMARSRNRRIGAGGALVLGSLGSGIALKRARERQQARFGKALLPRRLPMVVAPVKRPSAIRRGTFVKIPTGRTSYRRGSL